MMISAVKPHLPEPRKLPFSPYEKSDFSTDQIALNSYKHVTIVTAKLTLKKPIISKLTGLWINAVGS